MSDHVGVFIDGRYLLTAGVETLVQEGVPKVVPYRFNVLAFKSSVMSLVERLVPDSRILRIYWYECEAEDSDDEYRRRVILAKNGIKMRTSPYERDEAALATATRDRISDDIQNLTDHRAMTDALIVSDIVDYDDMIDDVQAKGVHVHVVEIQRRKLYLTLDLRAKVDTFSPWTTDSLKSFLLPDDGHFRDDQDRVLDTPVQEKEQPLVSDAVLELEDEESSERFELHMATAGENEETTENWAEEDDFDAFESETAEYAVDSSVPETADISPSVREYVEKMLDSQVRACVQYWSIGRRDVPTTHDKIVLAACREGVQRNLTPDERKVMRDEFMRIVNQQFVERGLETTPSKPAPPVRYSLAENRFQLGGDPGRQSLGSRFGSAPSEEVDDVAQTEITEYVEIFVAELNDDELRSCLDYWEQGQYGVPSMFDKAIMAMCRQELGRNLGELEKYFMRAEFKRITNEIANDRGVV